MSSPSNLSFVLQSPGHVSYEPREIPTIQDPNDVLIAITHTGICGSDVHYYTHGSIGRFVVTTPMILGHESAGVVVKTGSSVTSLKPGDRVAVEPGVGCNTCKKCVAGNYHLCADMQFAATPPVDGTLTGFWKGPARLCYALPDSVKTPEGALMEPLAAAVHITQRQGRVQPGERVVVCGAGPIGLLCAAVARACGATRVVVVDVLQAKLDMAKRFAATDTYISQKGLSPEENAKALIAQCGLGEGADVVIEASGAEVSVQMGLHVVVSGGRYVQGGMGKASMTIPIMEMCVKEVTVRGSFRYCGGDYDLAIELVRSGKIDVSMLVTETVPFERAEDAFKKVMSGEVIKILIEGPNSNEVIQQVINQA